MNIEKLFGNLSRSKLEKIERTKSPFSHLPHYSDDRRPVFQIEQENRIVDIYDDESNWEYIFRVSSEKSSGFYWYRIGRSDYDEFRYMIDDFLCGGNWKRMDQSKNLPARTFYRGHYKNYKKTCIRYSEMKIKPNNSGEFIAAYYALSE